MTLIQNNTNSNKAHLPLPETQNPSRVKKIADDALREQGITSCIEHHDPNFFKTKIFTVVPSLAENREIRGSAYPDLDTLLEAHLKKRWGDKWDTFSNKEKLKYKRALAGSGRNWDDLTYQVELENINAIEGLTPDQRKQLNRSPLIQETFCHNSPLNGESYFKSDGTRVNLTHAGSCSEDLESENIHLLRHVSYASTKETLYYTGRPETLEKAQAQAEWIFLRELEATGKGIIKNKDGSYSFTYVVNSFLDSYTNPTKSKDKNPQRMLSKEIETLEALKKTAITFTDEEGVVHKVHLHPILLHEQYNVATKVETFFPTWVSGKDFSDEIMQKGIPDLKEVARQKKDSLRDNLSSLTIKKQQEAVKKICYIDLALKKLDNYSDLTADERVFYIALLCRMIDIPMVIHCLKSKDRTGGAGKLICALYTWLDAGMPDDFSKIIGKDSDKNNPLRQLFDELVTGHLMAAHEVTNYGIGASGVIEGEELEADLVGLKISNTLPLIEHLPKRYTKERSLMLLIGYYLSLLIGYPLMVAVELIGIAIALLDFLLSTTLSLGGVLLLIFPGLESHFFLISRHILPTALTDLFIRPLYLFKPPGHVLNKKSLYVKNRSLSKPGRHIQMAPEVRQALMVIQGLKKDEFNEMVSYLENHNSENFPSDKLIELGRLMPVLSRVAKRSDFHLSKAARKLITTFNNAKKTEEEELEYLPENEFEHLCAFIRNENRGPFDRLTSREKIVYNYITSLVIFNHRPTTERQKQLIKACKNSQLLPLQLQRVMSLENINSYISEVCKIYTLSDWSYTMKCTSIKKDGKPTFVITDELSEDLIRDNFKGAQLYQKDSFGRRTRIQAPDVSKIHIPDISKEQQEEARKHVIVEALFESLKLLPAFADMEHPSLPLLDCLSQSGRLYGLGQLIRYLGLATETSQVPLFLFSEADWEITFESENSSSFVAYYKTTLDIATTSGGEKKNLGKIDFSFEHHFKKVPDSEFWESEFCISTAPITILFPPTPVTTPFLFENITVSSLEKMLSKEEIISELRKNISKTNLLIPTLSQEVRPWYVNRNQQNLERLKQLMDDDQYQDYVAQLSQEHAVT